MVSRIERKLEKLLKNQPHLTRAEAVQLLAKLKQKKTKSKSNNKTLKIVSGGAVSPR
ncbi:TPA: hypothetical protein NJ192_004252 [Vibrio parahaemolyticus]|nr:hypothetical protein [Vibrio parahaemolyticus]